MNPGASHRRARTYGLSAGVLLIGLLLPHPVWTAEEAGTVTVRIVYRGVVPPPVDIAVTRDAEVCGKTVSSQSIVVHASSGGVKDAVVMIEGLFDPKPEPASAAPLVVSNAGCSFQSHVAAVQTGVPIEIHNEDPILHNTHITYGGRTFFNVVMVANSRPISRTMRLRGVYRVQCDVHKFMRGYVVASEYPYFGVTDEAGHARILNVPAGDHEVWVWHESLGQLRARVTVPPNGDATVTFEFPGSGSDRGRPATQ